MKYETCALLVFQFSVIFCHADSDSARRRPFKTSSRQDSEHAPQPFEQVARECPEPEGFFPDPEQCDKYYECVDGLPTTKFCADGLVFQDVGPMFEKCEYPYIVNCTGREKLQTPVPSKNCARKYGYFAHEDPHVCDIFFVCNDGFFTEIKCPAGLVYSNTSATCTWADEANKPFCSPKELFKFECPHLEGHIAGEQAGHSRFADPSDCQSYIVCLNGRVPRKHTCGAGLVFNEATGECDKPKNVPQCYNGEEDFDEMSEVVPSPSPSPKPTSKSRGGAAVQRQFMKQVQVESEADFDY